MSATIPTTADESNTTSVIVCQGLANDFDTRACIIRNMPPIDRPHKITVRLSEEEQKLRETLEAHFGTDGSGVMRMGMLKLAREEGIAIPHPKPQPAPKQKPKSR